MASSFYFIYLITSKFEFFCHYWPLHVRFLELWIYFLLGLNHNLTFGNVELGFGVGKCFQDMISHNQSRWNFLNCDLFFDFLFNDPSLYLTKENKTKQKHQQNEINLPTNFDKLTFSIGFVMGPYLSGHLKIEGLLSLRKRGNLMG